MISKLCVHFLKTLCLPIFAVLIAHNGFTFDFNVLISEIKRNRMSFDLDELERLQFADSLPHLRKVIAIDKRQLTASH